MISKVLDVICTDEETYDEALNNLEKVLKMCQEHNLSLSHEKFFMMMTQGIVLGHFVSSKWIQMDPNKIEIISTLLAPQKQKDVRSFLGHNGYYRIFIQYFSKIAAPLFVLLTKDVEFEWTTECQHSFEALKIALTKALVLRGPNWTLPFHIHTNASIFSIGAVLGQKEGNKEYVIYYINKNLQGAELNYIVTKKEMLAIVYAINKFKHYIIGYPVFIHTDHTTIRYLMNKPIVGGRLVKWLLLLQKFDIIIVDKLGKANVVVDFLSRLPT